jgi:hypothetical protein
MVFTRDLSAVSLLLPLVFAASAPGVTSYVAQVGFPTSAFTSYYFLPAKPTQEPQPAIFDPVLNITFPANLTNPNTLPASDNDPIFYPVPATQLSAAAQQALIASAIANVTKIFADNSTTSNCTRCHNALAAAKSAALLAPSLVPAALVSVCEQFKFASNATCQENYAATNFGAIWTQILFFANVTGLDGQYICNSLSSTFCPRPTTSPLNVTGLFPKPKPTHPKVWKPCGKRVKVAHLSDFHIDPRYDVASEANCTSGSLCCRSDQYNIKGQVLLPASPYGSFKCDTPYDLGLAALQAVGPLTGTGKGKESLAWTVYTGDLVSHEPQSELSRAYAEYAETSIYGLLKAYLTGPVFAALGNHDSNPEAIDAPHNLPGPLGQQQSWNYDHVAGLWQHEGWIDAKTAAQAKTHYAGYSVKNHFGLRVITWNTGERICVSFIFNY